jgi:signal peptidase
MDIESQRRVAWRQLIFEQARNAGEVRLRVSGRSMLPALWPGDVVTVRRCSLAEFQPGQIVLFGQQQKLTVHRVVRVADDHLIARGDSLPSSDPPVTETEVVGKVVSVQRKGRNIRPERPLWQRVVASILKRSNALRRIAVLRAGDGSLQHFGKMLLSRAT